MPEKHKSEPVEPDYYEEISPPSPTEDINLYQGYRMTRRLACDYNYFQAMVRYLLGSDYYYPAKCPVNDKARAVGISDVVVHGGWQAESGRVLKPEKVSFTVEYSESWAPLDDEFTPRTELRTLDNTNLFWSDGTPVGASVKIAARVQVVDWTFTVRLWENEFDLETLIKLAGTVNDTGYEIGRIGMASKQYPKFPSQTLLYMGPQIRRICTQYGVSIWDVRQHFIYTPRGWNTALRPGEFDEGKPSWESLYVDDSAAQQYFMYPIEPWNKHGYLLFGDIPGVVPCKLIGS